MGDTQNLYALQSRSDLTKQGVAQVRVALERYPHLHKSALAVNSPLL